ncbi:MAG: hypothetical protein ACI841_005321 [Planctomycetota bacterium]
MALLLADEPNCDAFDKSWHEKRWDDHEPGAPAALRRTGATRSSIAFERRSTAFLSGVSPPMAKLRPRPGGLEGRAWSLGCYRLCLPAMNFLGSA